MYYLLILNKKYIIKNNLWQKLEYIGRASSPLSQVAFQHLHLHSNTDNKNNMFNSFSFADLQ